MGHDQFPQLSDYEDFDPDLGITDYGITSGIPQQLLEKNQQYPMQMRKETLISPSRSDTDA